LYVPCYNRGRSCGIYSGIVNCKNLEFIWNAEVDDIYDKFDLEGFKVRNLKTGQIDDLKADGATAAYIAEHYINENRWRGKLWTIIIQNKEQL